MKAAHTLTQAISVEVKVRSNASRIHAQEAKQIEAQVVEPAALPEAAE